MPINYNKLLKRKFLTPNDTFYTFGISVGVFLVVQFALVLTGMLTFRDQNAALWVAIMGGTLSLLLAAFMVSHNRNVSLPFSVGMTKAPRLQHLLGGIVALVGIMAVGIPLSNFFATWIGSVDDVSLPLYGDGRDVALLIVAVCILPAFCEELVFRGVIAVGLSRYGIVRASLVSGALFALFHMNPVQTVHQFIIGAVLGLFLLWGGSIWICVILHFLNNFLALVLPNIVSEKAMTVIFYDFWYITMAVGTALIVTGIIIFVKNSKPHFDKQSEKKSVVAWEQMVQEVNATPIMPIDTVFADIDNGYADKQESPIFADIDERGQNSANAHPMIVPADKIFADIDERGQNSANAHNEINVQFVNPPQIVGDSQKGEKIKGLPVVIFVVGLLVCISMWLSGLA